MAAKMNGEEKGRFSIESRFEPCEGDIPIQKATKDREHSSGNAERSDRLSRSEGKPVETAPSVDLLASPGEMDCKLTPNSDTMNKQSKETYGGTVDTVRLSKHTRDNGKTHKDTSEQRQNSVDTARAKKVLEDFIDTQHRSHYVVERGARLQLGRYAPGVRTERSHSDSDVGRLALRITSHSASEDSDTTAGSNSQPNTAGVQSPQQQQYQDPFVPGDRARNMALIRNIAREIANNYNENDIDDDFFDDFGIVPMELMDIPQPPVPTLPQFAVGESREEECQICFSWKPLHLRICCKFPACDDCMEQYCAVQVGNGILKIQCVSPDCEQFVHRDEILARLSGSVKDKFYKFLVDANKDPHVKTCPRCSHVMSVNIELVRNPKHKKRGLKVVCPECFLVWCFPCQAPWHEAVTCKEFRRGDKLLLKWAQQHVHGQANAQKCPKCKVFIQRSAGCDHMVCTRCKTNFCYRCGDKYREVKFLGDHYSRFSIFGCKYRFKPDHPVERKVIRGAIFGSKMLVAPVVGGLALAGGAALLGVGVLALPFYAGYKIHKQIEMEKRRKRRRQAAREWRAKVEAIRKKGEELEISMHQTKSDNLDEIMASYMEHSTGDDLDGSRDDSSDSSSDLDSGVKVTQVKVITEIVSPGFLLDDEQNLKISSTETLGDSSVSSLQEYDADATSSDAMTSPIYNAACVPSLEGQAAHTLTLHSDCDSTDTEDETATAPFRECTPPPTAWSKLIEKAPYADEESFSIADAENIESRNEKTITTFICHL